jgi:hypothetical protein
MLGAGARGLLSDKEQLGRLVLAVRRGPKSILNRE